MSTFSSQNFKVGPCTVIFKDKVLGETTKSSVIKFRSNYKTFTNDQITGIPIIRQLKDINIVFETEILAIDKGLDMLLDANGKITMEEINWMREPEYGELKLIPINSLDTTGYRFPRALLLRNSELVIERNDEHRIKLEFEAVYDENELMMEKIVVGDGDRVSLNVSAPIDSSALERAMTYYIADKLNITVDTDIFRGAIPPNVDGSSVQLVGYYAENSLSSTRYIFRFSSIDASRDTVMRTIQKLVEFFPEYGQNISSDIASKAIIKNSIEFGKIITDNGKIKALGELVLVAIL